jgi:hypothetical protein
VVRPRSYVVNIVAQMLRILELPSPLPPGGSTSRLTHFFQGPRNWFLSANGISLEVTKWRKTDTKIFRLSRDLLCLFVAVPQVSALRDLRASA